MGDRSRVGTIKCTCTGHFTCPTGWGLAAMLKHSKVAAVLSAVLIMKSCALCPSWRSQLQAQVLQASLLEREVGGLLHEEVSVAHISLVQHGVRLDGGHTWGVLDLQERQSCQLQEARAHATGLASNNCTEQGLPVRE